MLYTYEYQNNSDYGSYKLCLMPNLTPCRTNFKMQGYVLDTIFQLVSEQNIQKVTIETYQRLQPSEGTGLWLTPLILPMPFGLIPINIALDVPDLTRRRQVIKCPSTWVKYFARCYFIVFKLNVTRYNPTSCITHSKFHQPPTRFQCSRLDDTPPTTNGSCLAVERV